METWKPIQGYEGFYEISDRGRVFSLKRKIFLKHHPGWNREYLQFVLRKRMEPQQSATVHRLVARHFLETFREELQVNHKNGNKKDNRLENLEMVTAEENMKHAHAVLHVRQGRKYKGEEHYQATVTESIVHEIRRLKSSGMSYGKIAIKFGIGKSAVKHIANRRSWKHI